MGSEILSFPKLGLEFSLNRTAFSIGSLSIQWYGIIIGIGFFLGVAYAIRRSRSFGIHPDRFLDLTIAGLIGGIIGARAYFVIFHWDLYKNNPIDVFNLREGGLAFYGGLIGAVLFVWPIAKWRKVRLLPTLDITGLGFLIGQGIGRWGNFVNIEAFGSNTNLPWGMTGPSIVQYLTRQRTELASMGVNIDPNMPVHPCFLYESIWCLLGFVLLHFYSKKRKFDGEVFIMYLGWNGLGRFFIEGMRTDSLLLGKMRISQILAVLFVVAAIVLIIVIRSKIKRDDSPDFMPLYVTTEESKVLLAKIDEEIADSRAKKSNKSARIIQEEISPIKEKEENAGKAPEELSEKTEAPEETPLEDAEETDAEEGKE
ncbi:MAG: prolipoprotein diacylglyceryl transferase [Oscillospiraceae bacterium]|jgi:phosphatidylglycerol:prolipoprotein diacylglycerol transferase|nr:prolipoprotein diacylglyceryl transferase [Oscillospiraceae bacterium]